MVICLSLFIQKSSKLASKQYRAWPDCMDALYWWQRQIALVSSILRYTAVFVLKNHLTASYLYIRAENSSTGCMNILHGFCKMLWYCSILFILNHSGQMWIKQQKVKILFTVINVFCKALNFRFLTDLSEVWLLQYYLLVIPLTGLSVFWESIKSSIKQLWSDEDLRFPILQFTWPGQEGHRQGNCFSV